MAELRAGLDVKPQRELREGPARYFLPISLLTPLGWYGGPWGYREVSKVEAERAQEPRPTPSDAGPVPSAIPTEGEFRAIPDHASHS